jgi:hypothetical protein
VDARADLQREPTARQTALLLEGGAERPRRQLRVQQAKLHALARERIEQLENGLEPTGALHEHRLHVGRADPDRLARVGDAVEDHLFVELLADEELGHDVPHGHLREAKATSPL